MGAIVSKDIVVAEALLMVDCVVINDDMGPFGSDIVHYLIRKALVNRRKSPW